MRTLSILFITLFFCSAPCFAQQSQQEQPIDDAAISARLNTAIENEPRLDGAKIRIVSVNGYVILAGQALDLEQKQQASLTTAFASNNIRRLINELEVVETIDSSFEASDRALQEQITAGVSDLSPATIPVIHNGVVHLLGQVSRSEGDEVANAISRMQGVKNIRLSYEYIQ